MDANIHGIAQKGDAVRPATNRGCVQVPPPGAIPADDFIESFSGLMDKMASAVTNDKAVLEQLFTTTTPQYAAIKALLQEIKPQRGSINSGRNSGSNHIPDGDDMRKFKKCNATLQHAILKGWAKGGFCLSHGHGLPASHDSRFHLPGFLVGTGAAVVDRGDAVAVARAEFSLLQSF